MKSSSSASLYLQVADKIRTRYLCRSPEGVCLPSDNAMAKLWGVSSRTVREALIVLEAAGWVKRMNGKGTVVCAPDRPVALYCELNLLSATTPRFYGLVLDKTRRLLEREGYDVRIYMGRSEAGAVPGPFTCPALLADAQAGRLAGIGVIALDLDAVELGSFGALGLPVVHIEERLGHPEWGPSEAVRLAVRYLASLGRERVALIGWGSSDPELPGCLVSSFARELAAHRLVFNRDWCKVDLSHALDGAGWEEFREIWFNSAAKPDALVVTDENFLPEVVTSLLQLGIKVPEDLLVVAHQSSGVKWCSALPLAVIESDTDRFAGRLASRLAAALEGKPVSGLPAGDAFFRLVPLKIGGTTRRPAPTAGTEH
jgi:DNA-binding LacI/PurR family transcriptional regulator